MLVLGDGWDYQWQFCDDGQTKACVAETRWLAALPISHSALEGGNTKTVLVLLWHFKPVDLILTHSPPFNQWAMLLSIGVWVLQLSFKTRKFLGPHTNLFFL